MDGSIASTAAPGPQPRKALVFGVMAFGQFMALIDIQIVAASLNSIQAGLSAAPDEISWVQTAYLMAELVMIPFAGFLGQALSTRWLFTLSAGLFTLASALCGLAWDIQSMILFRAIQGFVGGAMVPTVFSTGFMLFTGKERALVPAILGIVATLAPTLGPTVGGWITDAVHWRWIFYINIIPGALVTLLSAWLIRVDRAEPALLKSLDWVHLVSMAVFLGGLQYVLEEGPRKGWLGDTDVCIVSWLSVVAFGLFIERSLRATTPIVTLTPFRRPTFGIACIISMVTGAGIYSATYLVPVFLGRVRDYSSLQIGVTVFVAGISMIVSAPLAARLSQRVDPRVIIVAGLSIFALALWMFSDVGPQWGTQELFAPHIVRGFAGMLCVVPAVSLALSGYEPNELRYASGLFNLTRNLGGAIGIAATNTLVQDSARLHQARFGEALGASHGPAMEAVQALAARASQFSADAGHALASAQIELGQMVFGESLTLAFADSFRSLAWLFLATMLLVPFCKAPPRETADAQLNPQETAH